MFDPTKILEAREKGEAPAKEKKVLSKDSLMKKTRVGSKGGAGGKDRHPGPGKGKAFVKGGQNGGKGKRASEVGSKERQARPRKPSPFSRRVRKTEWPGEHKSFRRNAR